MVAVENEIESITGRLTRVGPSLALSWFVVSYADGDEEYREGSLSDATDVAMAAGLTVVPPTHPGSFRWVRNP